VAEGARLESVYTGNRIVGSNPTPSAKNLTNQLKYIMLFDRNRANPTALAVPVYRSSIVSGGRPSRTRPMVMKLDGRP
jgi:hypothetical protein